MRSQLDKNTARLQFQASEMLENKNKQLKEEEAAKIDNERKAIIESAYTSIGSYIHNQRVKKQASERAMSYQDEFTTKALTEALCTVVENALLLNTEEYAKLNPNYKTEIKDTIKAFLESDSINEDIQNKHILAICEEIRKNTPPASLYLTEEQEFEITNNTIMSNDNVERSLDALSRDVRTRVANIVAKDQEELAARQDDIDYANEKEAEVAPVAPVEPAPVEEAPLADPEQAPTEAAPQPAPAPIMESKKPTLKIGKNQTKRGIVETLTINEANKMLAEGKEYNPTLALANTIKYLTILEALDSADIVSIGTDGYNRILSASGVNMNPVSKVNIPGSNIVDTPFATLPKNKEAEDTAVPTTVNIPSEDKKESDIRSKIASIINNTVPSEFSIGTKNNVYQPFKSWSAEKKDVDPVFDIPSTVTEQMYKTCYGEILTESQVREKFEKEGFDLDYVDFDTLCYDWQITKINR